MEKSQFDNYRDGVVTIYTEKERKTDFSAKLNPKNTDHLEKVAKLNFGLMSKRNQDMEFANQSGFTLSIKVKVRKIKGITAKHLAVIDGFLYAIKYVDSDSKNLYLYMEGVRKIAE